MQQANNQQELRTGYTTGTCAAAAALAAAQLLTNNEKAGNVSITLPDGKIAVLEIEDSFSGGHSAHASVRKDAGDDPDITNRALISCELIPLEDSATNENIFKAGVGVGIITKPGLQLAVGEAAINPVPREMISKAIATVTDKKFVITISVENGCTLAEKTFNPRLGIKGGISIIGTSGVVRPFSHQALREAINCALSVAAEECKNAGAEESTKQIILVPGHYGYRNAMKIFGAANAEIIEVSNEWGFVLRQLRERGFNEFIALGHPGKLCKLAMGYENTHSKDSPPALSYVHEQAKKLGIVTAKETETVEGLFDALSDNDTLKLGNTLADSTAAAMESIAGIACGVILINMKDQILGECRR